MKCPICYHPMTCGPAGWACPACDHQHPYPEKKMQELFRAPILVLDTETTGFPRDDWSRVIELGAVILDTEGNEVAGFEALVCPDIIDHRAEKALEINHILRADIMAARYTADVVADFRGWLAEHGNPYVTSFNVGFDKPMIVRMGLKELRWASCVMLRATKVMDEANALDRWDNGDAKWARLEEAARFFGVEVVGDTHRAMTDARTAANVAVAIRRREMGA